MKRWGNSSQINRNPQASALSGTDRASPGYERPLDTMRIKHLGRCTTRVGTQCRSPISQECLRIEGFISKIFSIELFARKRFQHESCGGCVNNILRSNAPWQVRSRGVPPAFTENFASGAPPPVTSLFDKSILQELVQFGHRGETLVMWKAGANEHEQFFCGPTSRKSPHHL